MPRIHAGAKSNRQIGVDGRILRCACRGVMTQPIDPRAARRQSQLDLGMARDEIVQAGQQPSRREGRSHAEREDLALAGSPDRIDGGREGFESLPQLGKAALRRLGRLDRLARTMEQRHTKVLLKELDLAADRPRRHVKLLCRASEARKPDRRLKSSERVQGRQGSHGRAQASVFLIQGPKNHRLLHRTIDRILHLSPPEVWRGSTEK